MSFLPAVRELFQPARPDSAPPALPARKVTAEATFEATVSFTTQPLHWRDGPVTWTFTVDREHVDVLAAALRDSLRIEDVTVT